MAERVPPPPPPPQTQQQQQQQQSNLNLHDPAISQSPPVFQSGTYVVQVPKDQIYRVPPPENALIVERHLRNPQQRKRACSCSFCFCCILLIAFVVIAIALGIGLSFAFIKSKNPQFQIKRFLIKNNTDKNPDFYDITLIVKNPNENSEFFYVQGGVASLLFKEQKFATGKFPAFHQDHKNSADIGILVKGLNIKGPKPKSQVSFSLKMDIPARIKTASFSSDEQVKFVITCDFKVDKLAKGTRILSQHCQTNRS